jgi:hypothetical protein
MSNGKGPWKNIALVLMMVVVSLLGYLGGEWRKSVSREEVVRMLQEHSGETKADMATVKDELSSLKLKVEDNNQKITKLIQVVSDVNGQLKARGVIREVPPVGDPR